MSRRKSARKRKRSSGIKLKLLFFVFIILAVGWTGMTLMNVSKVVKPLLPSSSHAFISRHAQAPMILLIQQSNQPAQLDRLLLLKADLPNRTISVLQLPANLSDGNTIIGQYLESRYYKEMQLAVEHQLAVPITNYIIQPRADMNPGKDGMLQSFTFSPSPGWWHTTVGLPLWLNSLNTIRTDLTHWQLLQLSWLIRDLHLESSHIAQTPTNALLASDNGVTLDPEVVDPVVQQTFINAKVKSEGTSVVVKNATNVAGLASLTSRFVANMGGEIVAVEPSDTAQSNSSITAEGESSLTQAVTDFLGIPLTKKARTGRERADVELIIGSDALVRLGK